MAVSDFDQDWRIDWFNKVIFCDAPSHSTEYTVTDFWRWARKKEASTFGVPNPHIIDTDGMGASYDLPRKVKLANGYTIEPSSLGLLIGSDSTLLDQNNNVLISDTLRTKKWWENTYIQSGLIIIAIIGFIITII